MYKGFLGLYKKSLERELIATIELDEHGIFVAWNGKNYLEMERIEEQANRDFKMENPAK